MILAAYVAQIRQHENGHDMWCRTRFGHDAAL